MSVGSVRGTDVGAVGVFSGGLQRRSTGEAFELLDQWNQLGYASVWIPESVSAKNVLTFSAVLLGGSREIVLATAIAVIWNRDPASMVNAGRTLADAYPGRFVLGMGVAHSDTVALRGHEYRRPLTAMRSYLEAMDEAMYDGHEPEMPAPRLLAALGPRMVALARDMADGVHPFLMTPERTATVREVTGPGPLVAVEQGVVLTKDIAQGRDAARRNLERFARWPNYVRHLERMGFDEDDLANGGSDRLIDEIYAVGGESAVSERIRAHHAAGADNVSIQVIAGGPFDEVETLRRLAPAITVR